MRNYFPAIKTQQGELVSLANGRTLLTEAQDDVKWALSCGHLEDMLFDVDAELVIVRVSDGRVVCKYNRQTKRWENEPL